MRRICSLRIPTRSFAQTTLYSRRAFSSAAPPASNPMLNKAAEIGQASVSAPASTTVADVASTVAAPIADLSDTVTAVATSTDFAVTTRAVHSFLDFIHTTVGLPWWASIITGVVVIRATLFPFHTKSTVATGKIAKIRPEMERLKPLQKRDPQKYRDMIAELFKRQNLAPTAMIFQLAYPLTNMAVWMSFFFGVRSLHEEFPLVAAEHPFWLDSLAASDPTYILPILSGLTMFLSMEITTADPGLNSNMQKAMKYGFRFLALIVTPLAGTQFSSGVLLYWVTSNVLTIFQNIVSRTAWFRHRYQLPPPPPLSLPGFGSKSEKKGPELITVDLKSLKNATSSTNKTKQ